MFEKESVKITRAEEFTFAPLFKNTKSGTNGWKTTDYKDLKRCAIALGIMHILRSQRTTYVTAWQGTVREEIGEETEDNRRQWGRLKTGVADGEDPGDGNQVVKDPSEAKEESKFEEVPQPKSSEEMARDLTLSEDILKQVVAQVGGLVVEVLEIASPPSPEEEEREDHLRAKEMECKVFWLNLAKETKLRVSLEQDCINLRASNANVQKVTMKLCEILESSKVACPAEVQRVEELTVASVKCDQLHIAELAKEKEQRAEE
ncbi:hypothetical protein AXG93_4201s1080 [Marchantia polymorpha subsp. ruderalis]|uniref:Uncharacterized protein n=1 Tax=Marchantia polymorpha subsp. ruderalis TaxID=1480154 RepID=A0A176WB54_MARPO|nr:hypothetical protein AXG93_4201s1080 [Marchantia polymorpha subsp. ruderalis]